MGQPEERDTLTRLGSITPERFARVRAIFEAAVERPTAERSAFAAGACGGDGDLLREVEGMLAAEGKSDPLLDGKAPSSAPEEGRFPAGTVLAGRYRILGLLGKGGMGEVYRAHDLILNQTVALKFLSPVHISEAALVRFRNEVRIARQVSHPNVCRVYDLGMVESLHFLSMEYIDGEDLASLLRRIGRLPQDKAIEFTRKICAGLSAAHERGVLHRDLKPANIMIDARGQVRITDFGLAALAAEIPLSDLRSGTPAYMSPEQKAGKEVTTRSDLYSLGLVLHEMFTGKARKNTQSSPSELVKDLDLTIERLILRCLEEEPKRRPSSALNVAMALPGGDPIAAALAAGETPSPEMVAASEEKEGFSPRAAGLCFAAVVLLVIAGVAIAETTGFLSRAPLAIPPDALADRAQQLLKTLGYTGKPGSTAYGFFCCDAQAVENLEHYERTRRAEILASQRPAIVPFSYRQTRERKLSAPAFTGGFPDQPVVVSPGTIRLQLDATGRLMRLEVQPWEERPRAEPVDWTPLFTAAGLDQERFTPAAPDSIPPVASDARIAWTGTYADNRTERVQVEAASWQGRPVLFDARAFPRQEPAVPASILLEVGLALVLIGAGSWVARRNLRLGRGDRRGAAVIGGTALVLGIGAWALGPAHVTDPEENPIAGLAQAALLAGVLWIFYIAIEPSARRHWPDSLISWSRLCSGQLRNPVVASHILAGIVAAEVFGMLAWPAVESLIGVVPGSSLLLGASGIGSTAHAVATWLFNGRIGLIEGLFFLMTVVLLRLLIRRLWTADLVASLLLAIGQGGSYGIGLHAHLAVVAFLTVASLVWMWLLRRFGFLPMMILWLFSITTIYWPVTITGWLAGRSMGVHLVPVAIAAWALWVILSSQRRADTETAS